MEVRERRYRASSSSTTTEMNRSEEKSSAKVRLIKPTMATTLKKLQVIYYLSKNGHLEHPHFIEVTHLAHHPLRLKDVLERLTVLRGKGMPSLYSWSCKRSYKNGYVWNDLAENDVIYPSEGPEYVLKGSQLIEACTENVEQIQVGNKIDGQDPIVFRPKRKILAAKRHPEPEEVYNNQFEDNHEEEEEEEEEYEEKISYNNTLPVETCSTTSNSRCSRGVSTDEIPETTPSPKNPQLVVIDNSSPPSTASSTISEKANNNSKRFEDGDPTDPFPGRGSVLRQLIACGGGGMVKPAPVPPYTAARKSSSLHKGVLCKTAAKAEEDEEMMIKFMSENPRFGNVQSEEKEYFSGSIVEGISEERVKVENGSCGLQKSSSYNEERSTKAGLGEVKEEEEVKREKGVKGRCLPIKKSSSKQSKK